MNDSCWRRRPDVPWRRSLDAVILFPPNAADAVTLAESGPEIWELLRTPITVETLVTALTTAHHADRAVVEVDVRLTLQRLAELGAIEEVEGWARRA